MKKQVFFIHGGDSYSKYEDYFASLNNLPLSLPGEEGSVRWTKTLPDMLGDDYEVFMPSMPSKYNAKYEEWSLWFSRYFPYLRDEVVLVGWSLGGMFLAKFLAENKLPIKIGKVFLLAAPCGTILSDDGNDCGSFQFDQVVLDKLAKADLLIEIWHSRDDFVVPFSHALLYEKSLPGAKTHFFDDKNHFLVPELPELIEQIKSI
jgi:predicted alpha/beta hydrolase family esterase